MYHQIATGVPRSTQRAGRRNPSAMEEKIKVHTERAKPYLQKRFGPKQDIQLLLQVRHNAPFNAPFGTMMSEWERIAADLNANEDFDMETTGKSCQQRFHALLHSHRKGATLKLKPDPENANVQPNQYDLLEELMGMMRGAGHTKDGRRSTRRPNRPRKRTSSDMEDGEETEEEQGEDGQVKRRSRKRYVDADMMQSFVQQILESQAEVTESFREMLSEQLQQERQFRKEEAEERRLERERERKAEHERLKELIESVLERK